MTLLASPPQVVGTISPKGLAALVALPPAERVVDLVEARLDLAVVAGAVSQLPDLRQFFSACGALERSGTPVLATIRLMADGGLWTEDAGRRPLFEELLSLVSWVDIEVESLLAADVVAAARARGRRVIVSHHDFAGTPDDGTLDRLVDKARSLGGDVVKIATAINALEDHDRLTALLRRHRSWDGGLALIGMGALGTPLRSYLPSVGSCLTYGYLDAIAAPGQIHAHELVRRLTADCPIYAEWRRTQGRL